MRIVMRRVLWTLVPIGSLGLLGWVPPLRIALKTKTAAAWQWFAGFFGGCVLNIVLASTVRQTPDVKDTPPAWVGAIELVYIFSVATYTAIASKALTPKLHSTPQPPLAPLPPLPSLPPLPQGSYGDGYGYAPYAEPAPVHPPQPSVTPTAAASNSADAAAAEVRAELRELRDLLGESAGGRQREGTDQRGES